MENAIVEIGLRTFLDSSPNGVVAVDAQGSIIYCNAALGRMFGYQPTELRGQAIEILVPARVRSGHAALRDRYFAAPSARPMGPGAELHGQRKDGTEFPAEISLTPVQTGTGMVVTAEIADISERRRLQEKLEAYAQDLERSNRELQDFAYVASHDLQEPLRKIQAFGGRLKERFSAELGEKGRDYIERMESAAGRMQRLIDDLLAYSRVGTKTGSFRQVALDSVLSEVLEDLSVRMTETRGQVAGDRLPSIEADPTQLRQLFQNLVSNSLKFRRPDVPPVVQIRSREHVEPDGAGRSRRMAVIEFRDNGIGFEQAHASRIFNIFERLHEREQYEGTGVGLAICRKIVERHGGRISAEGRPGEGAIFTVHLPMVQPRAEGSR